MLARNHFPAVFGYSSVALLGTFLIRNSGWEPMTLFTVLIGGFVIGLAILVYWALNRSCVHCDTPSLQPCLVCSASHD